MTREQVKDLLVMVCATYPGFEKQLSDKKATIDAWAYLLSEESANDIAIAFKTYVKSGQGKGFAPSVDQLIALTHKTEELSELTEGQAWALVNKALSRSSYYSEEEFSKLPPMVQKAVGSPSALRRMAIDENLNKSVESSNFMRAYRTVVEREKQIRRLPKEARMKLMEIQKTALLGGE